MASLSQVSIELKVSGEAAATRALNAFASANDRIGSAVAEVGRKVSSIESEFRKLASLKDQGVVKARAYNTAISALAGQLATLTGRTQAQAQAELLAVETRRRQEEASRRAAQAAEELARAQQNLDGSILRQAQAINQAVQRLDELNRLKERGVAVAGQYAQAELEIARALARTNDYLKSNGSLNTQKALAEIRAAQAARKSAADAEAQAKSAQSAAQAYNRLMASINPTIAAQQRLSQGVQTLRAAQRAGIITAGEAIVALRQLRAAHEALDLAQNRSALGINRSGLIMQQTGYQVGDFIVQVQSGTNAFVAFGQQATQLAGLLTLSTEPSLIALGTALAIVIPLATALGAALQRTGVDLSGVSERFGRLEPVISAIGSAFSGVGTIFINSINLIINNLETVTSLVVALGAAVLFKYAGGAALAVSATAKLSAAFALVQLHGFAAATAIIAQTAAATAGAAAVTLLNAAWSRFLLIAPQLAVFVAVFAGIQLAMKALAGEAKNLEEIDIRDIFAGTDEASVNLDKLSNQVGQLATSQDALNDRVELYRKLSASSSAEALGFTTAVKAALAQEIEAREALLALEKISLQQNRIAAEQARSASEARIAEIQAEIAAQEELAQSDVTGEFSDVFAERIEQLRSQLSAMELSYQKQGAELRLIDATLALIGVSLSDIETKSDDAAKNVEKQAQAQKELQSYIAGRSQDLENEIRVLELTLKYGRDSVEVQKELNRQAQARMVNEMLLKGATADQVVEMLALLREAQRLEGAIDGAASSTGSLSSKLSESSVEAARLTANLQAAASALSAIAGATISANIRAVGLRAQTQAIQSGRDIIAARVAGEIASERARLASALGSGDAAIRAAARRELELFAKASEDASQAQRELDAAIESTTESTSRGGSAAKKAGKEMEEAFSGAEKVFADAVITTGEFEEAMANNVVNAIDGVANAWADFVMRGFSDFKGFVRSILNSFKGMIAQMIAMAARNRIMIGLGLVPQGVMPGPAGLLGGGAGGGLLNLLGIGGAARNGAGLLAGTATGTFLSGVFGGTKAALGLGGYASAGLFNVGANAAAASAATGAGAFASTIGAAIPVLGAVVALFGLFRSKTKELDSGIRVTINNMDALVESFSLIERSRFFGLVRSRRTNYGPASEEIANPILDVIAGIQENIMTAAESLGISASVFDDFSYMFEASLKGLSDEARQQKITEELNKFGDAFAEMALGDTGLIREGETASEALTALSTSLKALNDTLFFLDRTMLEVSLSSADAARGLVEMMGGLEAFQQAQQFYFENFYSGAEQLELLSAQLERTFEGLELDVPNSVAAYRTLVEAQDLTTQSGRELYAALLQIAPQFMDVVRRTNELNGALGATGSAITGLSEAAQQEVRNLQQQLYELQGNIQASRAMTLEDLQSDEARELQKEIFALRDAQERAAQATRASSSASSAASDATQKLNQVTEERAGLERQLLELQGDTAALRRLDLEELDKSNRSLQERVWALEDEQRVTSEREGLERRLLELQGNTTELRRRELAELDESNRGLQVAIWRLEDLNRTIEDLNENDFATLIDFQRAMSRQSNAIKMEEIAAANLATNLETQLSSQMNDNISMLTTAIENLSTAISGMSMQQRPVSLFDGLFGALLGRSLGFKPIAQPVSLRPNTGSPQDAGLISEIRALRAEVAGMRQENTELLVTNSKYVKRSYDVYRKWDVDGLPPERT